MKINAIKGIDDNMNMLLEELYSSSFTTKPYIYHRYASDKIICFDVENNDRRDIIVCEMNDINCNICNRVCDIPDTIIRDFTQYLFCNYPKLKKIYIGENKIPLKQGINFHSLTDVCIDLPISKEEYDKRLGAQSRRHYRYYLKRLLKDYEKASITIGKLYNQSEDSYLIDALCQMKDEQSKLRHQPNLVKDNIDEIKKMAAHYGRLSYITIEGEPISILLFYKVKKEYYFIQTAYKSQYAKYSLSRGLLYRSILQSIDEGCQHFHFLWGALDYKKHYAADEQTLYSAYIFRHRRGAYLSTFVKIKLTKAIQKFKASKMGRSIKDIYKRIRY